MRQQLAKLEQLQRIDMQVHELDVARTALKARLAELSQSREDVGRRLKAEREKVAAVEAEKRLLETSLRIEEDRLKKNQGRLAETKTEKEYQAASKEVDAARRAKAHYEDESLRAIELAEVAKKALETIEAEYQQVEKAFDERAAEVRKDETRLDEQIAAFSSDRASAREGIDAAILKRYDNIVKKRGGIALAAAVRGTCGACNMGLPPQLYNQVLRGTSVETCPSCHRILYAKSPEPTPSPPA